MIDLIERLKGIWKGLSGITINRAQIRAPIYMCVPCLSFVKINNSKLPVILSVTLDRMQYSGYMVINFTSFIFLFFFYGRD